MKTRLVLIVCDKCGVKLRGARGVNGNGTGGIRALLPSPKATFPCPCGGEFRPDKPEQVWPEADLATEGTCEQCGAHGKPGHVCHCGAVFWGF
jgi:hypothetical protein